MKLGNSLFNNIVEASNNLIAALDLDYNFISFNPAYRREFKRLFNVELTLGMSVYEAYKDFPKDKQIALVTWEKAFKEDNFSTVRQIERQGEIRYFENSYNILWEGSTKIGAAHISRDVTEKVKVEKALREREERFHMLSKSANDAIYEWNLSNGRFWWNDGIYNLFGYSFKEVELDMRWWFDKIHADDRDDLLDSINEKIKDEISFWAHEYKFQKADGSYVFVFDRGYVMYNDSWEPLRVIGAMTDITERKKAEEVLTLREAKYRTLLKNSSDIISIIDASGNFSYVSPSVEKILGYTPEELLGKNRNKFFHQEDVSLIDFTLDKILKQDVEVLTIQNKFKHKNGTFILLESTYNNLLSEPTVAGVVINSRDVTERMATQIALKQSEATLKRSQRIAKMGNWEYDLEKGEMYWSEELFYVMKRNPKAGVPTFEEVLVTLLPENAFQLKTNFKRALEEGRPYNMDYGRIVDGKIQYLNAICYPVIDSTGNIIKLQGIIIDITSRKEAEERLLESEQWFKTIFNASRDGFVVELDEKIFYVNDALVKLFGYDSQIEILDRSITALFAEDNAYILEEYGRKRLRGEHIPSIYELKGKRKDGSIIHVEISASVFSIKGANYIIALVRDITERKQAEQKLMEQNEELKKINSELDRFVYSASHDLRAPLVSVLGLANILKLNETDNEKIRYLDLVTKSIHKLDRFIQEIIHHSRNSRVEVKSEEVDFKRIIEETFEDLRYLDGAENIQTSIKLQGKKGFYSDPGRITVVFNNLISNSIRYGCPLIRVPEIKIEIVVSRENAHIKISDNGQGIGAEHVDKIFDMFYRASQNNVGSGLGLYIVKETLQKLGGSIKVSSVINEGTTFEMVIANRKGASLQLEETNKTNA